MSLKGNRCIGILRELKYKWERRAPLVPKHVNELRKAGVRILVQPSDKRIFTDKEYEEAGAELVEDLSPASTIFGIKEIPGSSLIPERSYVLFNHVIKAQSYNMDFLDQALQKNVRLFDYETIKAPISQGGLRLVAFGHFAGLAGMVDILRGLGEHLLSRGYSTPFLEVSSSFMYGSVDNAKAGMRRIGEQIAKNGIPEDLNPLTFVFTGTGNVAGGAREMFDMLPHEMVDASQLKNLRENREANRFQVYGCQLEMDDIVQHNERGSDFTLQDYFDNPQNYRPVFHENVAPYTSVLVNGIYWDRKYPRLLTKDQMRSIHQQNPGSLHALADITCDIDGSVEFLAKSTEIESPFYTYDVEKDSIRDGVDGRDIVVLGVDILPSEFPRESSEHFSNALLPFIDRLSSSDGTKPFDEQKDLPEEFHNSCIASNGSLTPKFGYIDRLREEHAAERQKIEASRDPVTSILLNGHIFDSGLINQALDVVEVHGGKASIVHWETGATIKKPSRAVVQLSATDRDALNTILSELATLVRLSPRAGATLTELPYGATQSETRTTKSSTGKQPASQRITAPKHILLLGSGRTAGPVVEYLSKSGTNTMTIGSNDLEQAQALGEDNPYVVTKHIEASDLAAIAAEVQESDVVISLLPATCHVDVANICLKYRTDLVTASYVSPEMQDLHEKAKSVGVSFVNEVGLDPGIDHMSAMKIIDQAKSDGDEIISFESNCGGLPAPEAASNPLGYKFSWSPMGVLSASQNSAVYKRDGQIIEVDSLDLLNSAVPYNINPAFNLETVPNRDSLSYSTLYGIPNVNTMYRGTLRYQGFCEIMSGFRTLGLLSNDAPSDISSWAGLTSKLVSAGSSSDVSESARMFLSNKENAADADSISRTMGALNWLGILSKDYPVSQKPRIVESFCDLLEEKLTFGETERDMVLLHHRFGIKQQNGDNKTLDSTLLCYGEVGGHSAMAKTVGLPVAVCTQMILDGEISSKGVLTPVTSEIYDPCLEKLSQNGIEFDERIQDA